MRNQGEITLLVAAARNGKREALDRLFQRVYGELHAAAHRQLARGRPGETLSTTALVHETYIKLIDTSQLELRDRRHFFAVAARAMRQIVIDHARSAHAQKRGGGAIRVSLEPSSEAEALHGGGNSAPATLLALDQALTALEVMSERLARVVELRFFAGLSVEETGLMLELSPRTVKRDWRKARAFLHRTLEDSAPGMTRGTE